MLKYRFKIEDLARTIGIIPPELFEIKSSSALAQKPEWQSALGYLGKEQVNHEVFEIIRSKVTPKEYTFLKASASQIPCWMADALHKYEKSRNTG